MRPNKKLKKAQADNFVILVLFLVILATLLYFYLLYNKGLSGTTPKQICKSSVKMNAASHIGDLYLDSELKCPTQYINIDKRKKDEVMGELAKYMYDCWDMFWEGELNLFPQEEGDTINYCVVCHHIIFKEKMIIPATEFLSYLKENKRPGETKTYQQYLSSSSTRDDAADFDNPLLQAGQTDLSNYNIDTSVPYVTLFTYNKQGYWSKISTTLMGTGIGATAGIITGIVLAPFTGGGSLVIAAVIVGTSTAGTAGGAIIGYAVGSPKVADWQSSVQLMPYELSQLKGMQCNYLPVPQTGDSNE
jgi:hypothetical protein